MKKKPTGNGRDKGNSAIVHAGFDTQGTLKAKFNLLGSLMMERFSDELGVKYQKNGSLVVGFEHERAEVEELYKRGLENGVAGLRIVEREELLSLEPNINPELSLALYAETGAIVCPYELCIAAMGNAMDNGAELKLNFKVTGIERESDGFKIKARDGRSVDAKYIVNSAGLYSDEIAKMTGDGDFRITPRKGEYMILDKEFGRFTERTIFHTPTKMGKGILISPTVDGNLLLGPTATDVEDKEDKSTTVEGFSTLFKKAADNVANLPFGRIITSFAGLRAVGSTGDFIIKSRENVVTLGGIESPGLTAAPAIAEHVAELLSGMGVELTENENYNPIRKPAHHFRSLSAAEKNGDYQSGSTVRQNNLPVRKRDRGRDCGGDSHKPRRA